jgi:glycogen operon protein
MNQQVNLYPTHRHGDYNLSYGHFFPYGATVTSKAVSFSIHSREAYSCTLVLFHKGALEPFAEIPFPPEFRIGDVFSMAVFDLDPRNLEYGFRFDGPRTAPGDCFDSNNIVMDPYAKIVGGRDSWGSPPRDGDSYPHRSQVLMDDFDWENDLPIQYAIEDLVIYEVHIRSFTRHPSSRVARPGTYAGFREKIPYLKELGVNCVELMPVFEFDELENDRENPLTQERLYNYWGYSSVGFFAPKSGYAGEPGQQVNELKALIKELHLNGIEVILDVVFNHTAEGNEHGPTLSFKGIDNRIYYLLTPDGRYYNFSGCGNTFNCNHPIVRGLIINCLRYWVYNYHIDGFRFDLASILGRDMTGAPLANPPLIETLAHDPVMSHCKLIAEAWDAAGLYQVGSFPAYRRWAEWNGKYRDGIRRFLRSEPGVVGAFSQCIQGSPDLYFHGGRGADASINFITCHDGFTLHDLFAYNEKHNEANGEGNRDGSDYNLSWNCGVEGPTDDPEVIALRKRQIKNALTLLMLSRGIPMIYSGDEIGRTQYGNNNNYCHDSELSWLDWRLLEENGDLFGFFRNLIAFRRTHPILRSAEHYRNEDYRGVGYPDISWHGVEAWQPDWSYHSRTLAFLLSRGYLDDDRPKRLTGKFEFSSDRDEFIYVACNMHWEPHSFDVPRLPPSQMSWYVAADTGLEAPNDSFAPGQEPLLETQENVLSRPRSIVVLVGR